jgi:hypothetical protein
VSEYGRLYRRAEVRERWANIYAPTAFARDWMRFAAAQDRLFAEFIKGLRLEEIAAWADRQLAKHPRLYRRLS